MVAHTHYHNEDSNFHKHFHYHLKGDNPNNQAHDLNSDFNHTDKNIVTCLLYNKGIHDGSDLNIFFNQFIHHPEFKAVDTNEKHIKVHDQCY